MRPLRRVSIALIALAVLACTSGEKSAPAQSPSPSNQPVASQSWPEKMQSLSVVLSELLPLVVSRSKFNNEKNFAKIEADTRSLRKLAHGLKSGSAPNADPTMKVMSGLFEEDLERALDSLNSGNRDYARQILKDTSSYCVQCHTQTNNGPDFPRLDLNIKTDELPAVEQAQFFAATRQFDRALAAYEKALSDPGFAKIDPFEWEQSARSALAIVVRVKHEPKAALKLLSGVRGQSALPASTKTAIAAWKKSLDEWAREKKPAKMGAAAQVTRAEELIQQAQKRQEFPLDHSQDIVYFRAASLLHEFLQAEGPREALGARALYLAGLASEATRDMNFWTLHESYYEQCIRVLPKTKQAQQCYERLKDSITLGYSGSGGIRIPPEVSKRLENFRLLADPSVTN